MRVESYHDIDFTFTEKATAVTSKASRKLKMNTTDINEKRRPLTSVNRARMNDEERQETRKQLFKKGSARAKANSAPLVSIKGVRMNRRFELMMKNRNKN